MGGADKNAADNNTIDNIGADIDAAGGGGMDDGGVLTMPQKTMLQMTAPCTMLGIHNMTQMTDDNDADDGGAGDGCTDNNDADNLVP